jgi:hypothetical protein
MSEGPVEKAIHHIEIHHHEGGGMRVEHHFGEGDHVTHIKHIPRKDAKEGMDAEEMHEHLEDPLAEMNGEMEGEDTEEESEKDMNEEKAIERHQVATGEDGNSPLGIGRGGKVRQY